MSIDTEVNNAILVFEDAGQVRHCYCTQEKAEERLRQAKESGSGASMFRISDLPASFVYDASPTVRDRVEVAKAKLRRDIAMRDALDRNVVTKDRDQRNAIYQAITELQQTVFRPVW